MDWTRTMDNYCERIDASYWSEPVNAITNAAFLIAAFLAWRIVRDRSDWGTRALLIVLSCIGIGSYLFHTHANLWSVMLDVLPIYVYICVYLWLATRRMLGLPIWAAWAAVAANFVYTPALAAGIGAVSGGLNGSEGYVPTLLLIAGYGLWLLRTKPETGRGLLIGAGILAVSLTARTVDEAVCDAVPLGTHWAWHVLNGVMLGWMIVVLDRHDRRHPMP